MSAEKLRNEFEETRASTTRPFIINFFAHDTPVLPSDDAASMRKQLAVYYEELGLGQDLTLSASPMRSFDAATLEAVLGLRPEIVSFHFGLPSEEMLDALKSSGSIILCSATTVAEARKLEAGGVHAIIAQGYDAGGHRGTFSAPVEAGNVGTFALIPQVVDAVSVPVIAAGGIADGRGIAAAFALGASGVQMGTAFLLCPESAASPIHRQVLQQARDDSTVVTRAFTGRPGTHHRQPFRRGNGLAGWGGGGLPTAGQLDSAASPRERRARVEGFRCSFLRTGIGAQPDTPCRRARRRACCRGAGNSRWLATRGRNFRSLGHEFR